MTAISKFFFLFFPPQRKVTPIVDTPLYFPHTNCIWWTIKSFYNHLRFVFRPSGNTSAINMSL